jgi:hypothetical protein
MGEILPCMGEIRNVYKILVGNPGGKKPFGRFTRGCENEIRPKVYHK